MSFQRQKVASTLHTKTLGMARHANRGLANHRCHATVEELTFVNERVLQNQSGKLQGRVHGDQKW
jgi:hypothetical protein